MSLGKLRTDNEAVTDWRSGAVEKTAATAPCEMNKKRRSYEKHRVKKKGVLLLGAGFLNCLQFGGGECRLRVRMAAVP